MPKKRHVLVILVGREAGQRNERLIRAKVCGAVLKFLSLPPPSSKSYTVSTNTFLSSGTVLLLLLLLLCTAITRTMGLLKPCSMYCVDEVGPRGGPWWPWAWLVP